MSWYLRKPDQTIYGPTELETLIGWAAQGRVLPEDAVSSDQKTWHPAPDVAALKLEWVIDDGNGSNYGPVHVLALAEMVRDGSLTALATVRHRADGTTLPLAAAVLPALLAAPPPAEPDPELERLRAALANAEARVRELESAARPPPAECPVSDAAEPVELVESFRDLSHNYDSLLARADAQAKDHAKALGDHAMIQRELEQQLKLAQEQGARERHELEAIRSRMAEVEKNHLELVRSYRDLNDRYIVLRQQRSESNSAARTPPAPAKGRPA